MCFRLLVLSVLPAPVPEGPVSTTELPASPVQGLRTVELTPEHEPLLQRFFEANPLYFVAVNGEPATPNEAHEEIRGELPSGWPYTKKWLVGYVDDKNALVAMAIVVSDLLAASVWHVGLFIVATSRHGTGLAQELYEGLEAWAAANGATWLRLGVVKGNARAERFWERQGFIQVRLWHDVKMGRLTNTLRTMVKPLTGESIEIYLSRVERDRPEAEPDT